MRNSNHRTRGASWIFPIVLGLCAAVVAFIVSSFLPKMYKSESTLLFPAQADTAGSLLGSLNSLTRGSAGGLTGDAKSGQVSLLNGAITSPQFANGPQIAIAIMNSKNCRQRIVTDLKLAELWDIPERKAVKRLEGMVSLSVDKDGLLALEASDEKPKLTQDVLNAYISTVKKMAQDLSLNVSSRNRKFLEDLVTATRNRINVLNRKLKESIETDPDFPYASSMGDAVKGLVDLEQRLIQARVGLQTANAALIEATRKARAVVQTGTELPMNVDTGRTLREDLAKLEYEFSVAQVELGPDNPRYLMLKNQVARAREQYKREIARESKALDKGITPEIIKLSAERASFDAQVTGLQRAYDDVKARMDAAPPRKMRRDRIEMELKLMGGRLEYLGSEYVKAQIAEDRDPTTFQILDPPDLAVEPFAPRKGFTAAMAGVAGLLVGVAFLVARSSMKPEHMEIVDRDVAVV